MSEGRDEPTSTSGERAGDARSRMQARLDRLPADERAVIERFISGERVLRNTAREFDGQLTFGERVSDKVAAIGGSWTFILLFLAVLVAWMLFNTFVLARGAFDPYPYILLNLVLSCVAAIQAPIIMMSQRRHGDADRRKAEHDYEVNVKSELEIMQLHAKLDELRERDWSHLVAMQNEQIALLQQLLVEQGGAVRPPLHTDAERGQS